MITTATAGTSLIFVSETVASFCQNRTIMCGIDATFKVVPRVGAAYQLFGIYLLLEGTVRIILRLH